MVKTWFCRALPFLWSIGYPSNLCSQTSWTTIGYRSGHYYFSWSHWSITSITISSVRPGLLYAWFLWTSSSRVTYLWQRDECQNTSSVDRFDEHTSKKLERELWWCRFLELGYFGKLDYLFVNPFVSKNYSIRMLAQDRLQNTKSSVRPKKSFSITNQFCWSHLNSNRKAGL